MKKGEKYEKEGTFKFCRCSWNCYFLDRASIISYLANDPVIYLLAIASGYYLAKWIIKK